MLAAWTIIDRLHVAYQARVPKLVLGVMLYSIDSLYILRVVFRKGFRSCKLLD